MTLGALFDVLKSINLHSLRLIVRDPRLAREYLSQSVQRYRELMTDGLPGRDPLCYLREECGTVISADERVEIPLNLPVGGGMRLDEMLLLALVARALRPMTIFEIGTFMGRTTSVLMLNSPPGARVLTLDLPPIAVPDAIAPAGYIASDVALIKKRRAGALIQELRLADRCEQIYCDSLEFDPLPYHGLVELGLIDGAHSRRHVENDTMKMAAMMAERGIVFWHDYGGRGSFRGLTEYLEELASRVALYRVPNTTLAWTTAQELRKLSRSA